MKDKGTSIEAIVSYNWVTTRKARTTIRPWLSDKPRHANSETQPFLFALAFLETILKNNVEARESYIDLIVDLQQPGCQHIIEEAKEEKFDCYTFANKLLTQGFQDMTTQSAMLQRTKASLEQGTFDNDDCVKFCLDVKEFIEIYCNSEADYCDEKCKVTIISAPALFGAITLESLFSAIEKHPDAIDQERFGDEIQTILDGNPTANKAKEIKAGFVSQWKALKMTLHNDSYYLRIAQTFYGATVNPGKLIDYASNTAEVYKGNPATVKRRMEKDINIFKTAVIIR